jgi:hypothetical protein
MSGPMSERAPSPDITVEADGRAESTTVQVLQDVDHRRHSLGQIVRFGPSCDEFESESESGILTVVGNSKLEIIMMAESLAVNHTVTVTHCQCQTRDKQAGLSGLSPMAAARALLSHWHRDRDRDRASDSGGLSHGAARQLEPECRVRPRTCSSTMGRFTGMNCDQNLVWSHESVTVPRMRR